jgi:hypothetical protein
MITRVNFNPQNRITSPKGGGTPIVSESSTTDADIISFNYFNPVIDESISESSTTDADIISFNYFDPS